MQPRRPMSSEQINIHTQRAERRRVQHRGLTGSCSHHSQSGPSPETIIVVEVTTTTTIIKNNNNNSHLLPFFLRLELS